MASPYWNAAYPQIVKSDSPYKDKIGLALVPGVKQADGSIKRTPFQHGWSPCYEQQLRKTKRMPGSFLPMPQAQKVL